MTSEETLAEVLKEIRKVTAQNNEIKQQNEEIKKEILNVKKEHENDVNELRSTIVKLKEENDSLKERVIRIERQLKKYNILLHGIKEEPSENVENTVYNFLKENLKIELNKTTIRNVYRIGQGNTDKTRPILLELLNSNAKQEILQSSYKLKGTGKYISHDLTSEDLEINKLLWDYKKKAKVYGIEARVLKGKLIVNEKIYSLEEVLDDVLDLKTKAIGDKEADERSTRLKTKRLREEHATSEQSNKKNKNK